MDDELGFLHFDLFLRASTGWSFYDLADEERDCYSMIADVDHGQHLTKLLTYLKQTGGCIFIRPVEVSSGLHSIIFIPGISLVIATSAATNNL